MEAMVQGMKENESQDYGSEYQTRLDVKVVKKDGTRESFNVQKVVNAVGKSAYRALTKFTDEEKRKICCYVIERWMSWSAVKFPFRSCIISWRAHWRR